MLYDFESVRGCLVLKQFVKVSDVAQTQIEVVVVLTSKTKTVFAVTLADRLAILGGAFSV